MPTREQLETHGKEIERALQVLIGAALVALLSQVGTVWENTNEDASRLRLTFIVGLGGFGMALMASVFATIFRCLSGEPTKWTSFKWTFAMLAGYGMFLVTGYKIIGGLAY